MYRCLLSLLLLLGCASKQPVIDYDPDFSTAVLKRYTLVHVSEKGADSLNEERIRAAIIREMKVKGYQPALKAESDFHITFESMIKEDVPSNMSFGFGFGSFSKNVGTSIGTSHNLSADEGHLIIKMIDPKSEKTFWQAAFTKSIRDFSTPKQRSDYFNTVVFEMLQTFPPRSQ